MVPCMPHPMPGMQQILITIASVWKHAWKIFLELPLTHPKFISFFLFRCLPSPLYHTDICQMLRKFSKLK